MGIPAFFSKISDAYPSAFVPIKDVKQSEIIDVLYMDANSTIYDIVNELTEYDKVDIDDTLDNEAFIFLQTVKRIENYILAIKPNLEAYISFDGIAPIGKMEQQRCRRYRSSNISKIDTPTESKQSITNKFSVVKITPGTDFMKKFASFVDNYFKELKIYNRRDKLIDIFVSTSEYIGEGEHKIFNHVRRADNFSKILMIYGLDADLIVLSLFNVSYCKNIFLIRDPVDYTNSEKKNPYSEDMVCIDINILTKTMADDVRDSKKLDNKNYNSRHELDLDLDLNIVHDYLFLCIMLGNDFIPHNPILNVRTNGMQILKDLYRIHIFSHKNRRLIKDGNIEWKWVSLIMKELYKNEREILLNEYKIRDGIEKSVIRNNKQDDMNNIPILFRNVEKYINPDETGWENRYYKSLFNMMDDSGDKRIFNKNLKKTVKNVCENYLEGLEWVYKYYTNDCVDWQWKYEYLYPPLFKDLSNYTPKMNVDFLEPTERLPINHVVQLLYVMNPNTYYKYNSIPKEVISIISQKYPELFIEKADMSIAFCRYFWEAHPIIPEITIDMVKEWIEIVG